MRVSVDLKTLQAGIATVVKSLSSRPSLPILEGIYVEASSKGLLLRCSDLTLQIESLIEANVEEEGAVVLPGRLFSEMMRRISAETVSLQTEGKAVLIEAGRSKTSLQYNEAQEFPDMSEGEEPVRVRLPQDLLKEMIRQSVFAAAQEETKPILTGVLCEIEDSSFRMVALDGFRLALKRATVKGNYARIEAVVPAKSMMEISRTLLDTDDEIEISFSKTHFSLDLQHTRVISRLLDGDYIKYDSILPKEHTSRIRINREELLNSIERATLLAREGNNNLVKFTVQEKMLLVSANSALGRMEEEIEIDLNGEPLEIAFNARYFSDALKTIAEEEIYLDMINNVSPCVVRPIQGESYYYLILPVRIFS